MTPILETTQSVRPIVTRSELLTLEEAAQYLRLTPDVLRRSAQKSQVPGKLFEGEWRFSKGAIDRWIFTPTESQTPILTQEAIDNARAKLPRLLEVMKTWNNPDGMTI